MSMNDDRFPRMQSHTYQVRWPVMRNVFTGHAMIEQRKIDHVIGMALQLAWVSRDDSLNSEASFR